MTTKKIFNLSLTNGRSHEQSILMDGSGGGSNPPSFNKTENYFDQKHRYVENACGTKNIQRVNLRTGKLSVTQYVYGVNGRRLPFNLSLSYNPTFESQTEVFNDSSSDYTHGKLIAKGWKFNYQQYIREQSGKFYYYDENFNLHVFEQAQNSTSVYYDKSGQTGLTLYAIETGYEIDDGKNTKLQFNARGELVKIIHKKGSIASELTITYNSSNLIASITDGAGRTFTFEYDDHGSVLIKQGETRIVTFTVFNSILNNVVYLQGYESGYDRITFEYNTIATNSNCLISCITDYISDNACTFEYNDAGTKVLTIHNFKMDAESSHETSFIEFDTTSNPKRSIVTRSFTPENSVATFVEDKIYYYFAENGEMIYSAKEEISNADEEETLFERANAFLTESTFATAKEFEYYDVILAGNAIEQFKLKEYWISVARPSIMVESGDTDSSETIDLPKLTEYDGQFMLSAKVEDVDGNVVNGNVTFKLKEDDNEITQFSINSTTPKIQKSIFTLTPEAHSVKVEVTNNTSKDVVISDVKLYYIASTQKEVISYGESMGTTWEEVKKCNITIGNISIPNVDFTFNDYVRTILSYTKYAAQFNVSYNNCKNVAICYNISDLTFTFENKPTLTVDNFKYALQTNTGIETQLTYLNIPGSSYFEIITKSNRENSTSNKYIRVNEYFNVWSTVIDSVTTGYSFDDYGNCIRVQSQAGDDLNCNVKSEREYLNGDLLVKEKTFKQLYEYVTEYEYDSNGRLIKTTLPSGQVINYANNSADQLTAISSTVSSVENKNNMQYYLELLSGCNANSGNGYAFSYDRFNNLKTVTQGNNTLYSQNIYYNSDKSGFVEITYGNGYVEKRYFDKYGHIYKISSINGSSETDLLWLFYGDNAEETKNALEVNSNEYKVSKNSKLYKVVDKTEDYGYNEIYYSYDAIGNVTRIDNGSIIQQNNSITRDKYNRVVETYNKYELHDQRLNYAYTNNFSEQLESETYNGMFLGSDTVSINTSYACDQLDRPTRITVLDGDNNGYRQEITYYTRDKLEPNTEITPITPIAPFALTPTYKLVEDGTTLYIYEIKTYKIANSGSTLETTERVSYDDNGNITRYGNNTYEYDGIGRLTRENNADLNHSYTYEYDSRGNVVSKKTYAYTTGTLDDATATLSYTYDGYDRLTSTGYI